MVIMIDQGAAHNFLSNEVIVKMNIPIITTGEYGVTMGKGEFVHNKGVCQNVHVHLQGVDTWDDFLLMHLCSADVILGLLQCNDCLHYE